MIIVQNAAIRAARAGRSVNRWLQDVKVTAAFVVSTNASIYFDIPAGKQVIIKAVLFGTTTEGDGVWVYPVACSAIAGGGTPTTIGYVRYASGAATKSGNQHFIDDIPVPFIAKYSEGARSVSLAVKATSTETDVTFGWSGWYEDEGTLT